MAFESKKYWIVQALFEKDKQQFIALHKKGRFWEQGEAEKAAQCKKAKEGTVQQVKKTKKVLSRPVPFNTTLFLRAATAIGFSAGRAMQIAETLYQQGLTSYPRTDNSVYPPALDLRAILSQLATVHQFAPMAGQLLNQKKLEASKGAFAKDHPPIHPVAAPSRQLQADEWRIYELICRRFMATLAEDALTENLAVEIELAKELFVANGQRYLNKGWKLFYPYSKAEETILPVLQKGDKVLLVKLDMLAKETLPPPRYSQGALIKEMSDLNLGTKATRAEIIQKLYARKYISGQKAIEPNKIAFAVIDSLEKYDGVVVKPKMTADLEKEMDTVAEGKKEKKAVVDESRQFLSSALQQLLQNKNEIGSMLRAALRADAIIGKCTKPGCDGELLMRHGRTGKRFLGCSAYPKCTNTFPLPQKGSITVLQKRCDACGNFMIQVGGRRYRFSMCIDPNCKSKDEWKKKREERIRAQGEKEAAEKAAEKKVVEEAAEKKAAEKGAGKKVAEKGAEKKVAEDGAGKIKELKALSKKKKAKGSKLKETGQETFEKSFIKTVAINKLYMPQGTEKKKKSRNLKPRGQANEKEEEGA
jgi:DNA topoisomerase-1